MPPTTRTRTGKLPTKVLPPSHDIEDIEDIEDVEETEDIEIIKRIDDGEIDLDGPTLIDPTPQPERFVFETFTTFKSKNHLRDGLSLVRHLGGGKYEIVSLQHSNPDIMGSEEVGDYLRSEPKRLELFNEAKEGFEVSKVNIEQAADSANLKIFRFLKLPAELRLRVYDFTVKADVPLRYKATDGKTQTKLALNIRGVNKQINRESSSIFFRNTFRIQEARKHLAMYRTYQAISPSLREVTFEWWAWAIKDKNALELIGTFPNVKIFNLVVTQFCVNRDFFANSQRRQYLHQDVDGIDNFKRTNGFDALMALRGFEKVNVISSKMHSPDREVSLKEMLRFEKFLNEHLTAPRVVRTKPKPKDVVGALKGVKGVKDVAGGALKRKRRTQNMADDGDESEDLNYKPSQSRRRAR
ncbi:hypothetical protein GLAREA_08476 [Glarea lozoyensis ATCC 20868]|uniref:Uncharacterized protein n=1 Tax=Glarea lozoyensis (strain ATCC 20868 / MF5171) TaxID=1116229 RepID=S3DD61_GLAL2|nr:uncharacterized protein GLAREA_08476 [Glarea lozoyensis ATCC 20868]EPE24623.1 hypothetical protein GLAREA_08476 [Glarea lozoyensis ATCC 20868]